MLLFPTRGAEDAASSFTDVMENSTACPQQEGIALFLTKKKKKNFSREEGLLLAQYVKY